MMRLDHLAVCAETLDAGGAYVQGLLGVPLAPGGEHAAMSTHNRLLSLGPETYLEVIAIDPGAPPVDHPRWFDLDNFSGAPRLTNWVVQVSDMGAAQAAFGPGIGAAMQLQRGDLRWSMAVPGDGKLPFDNKHPAVIEWQGAHPAPRLPDQQCRLHKLKISHPRATELGEKFQTLPDAPIVAFVQADTPGLVAEIATPTGIKVLK